MNSRATKGKALSRKKTPRDSIEIAAGRGFRVSAHGQGARTLSTAASVGVLAVLLAVVAATEQKASPAFLAPGRGSARDAREARR